MIECNCFLINKQLSELDIPQQGEAVRMIFNVSSIESIRETFDDYGNVNPKECIVYFKSGENMCIDKSFDEIATKFKNQ